MKIYWYHSLSLFHMNPHNTNSNFAGVVSMTRIGINDHIRVCNLF